MTDASESPTEPSKRKAPTKEELDEWQATFELFDKNHDGAIEVCEVHVMARALGFMTTDEKIKQQIELVDKNANGKMDFKEFQKFMMNMKANAECDPKSQEKDMIRAFQVFDFDGNNTISADELIRVVTNLGEPLTEEEAQEMIATADLDNDGKLDYKEFCKFLCSK